MNDFLDDNRASAFLSGAELLSLPLPQVRKGGVDELAVRALLERAAVTIDGMGAHADRLEAENVRLAQEAERAVADAARSQSLLAGPAPVAVAPGASGSETAASMLAAAERVAEEVRAAAEQSAQATREAADAEADAIVAQAQAHAEEVRARALALDEEIEQARARSGEELEALHAARDAERAELEAQLAHYREVAGQVHLRAVGSLEAALATLNSYVASVAEDDEDQDAGDDGDATGATDPGEGISDAWEDELSFDDDADAQFRRLLEEEAELEARAAGGDAGDGGAVDEIVYVVEVLDEPTGFGEEVVVHETDAGVWLRTPGMVEDPGTVAEAIAATHPLDDPAAGFPSPAWDVPAVEEPADEMVAGVLADEVPPAPPVWGPPTVVEAPVVEAPAVEETVAEVPPAPVWGPPTVAPDVASGEAEEGGREG